MANRSGYEIAQAPVEVPRVETAYRRIVTAQPAPGSTELIAALRQLEPSSMTTELPVRWHAASGFQVEDGFGNRWLDFTSGIFVANAGHAHPRVTAAIREAVDRPLLHAYSFATDVRRELLAKALEMAPPPFDCALLLTTGAETTEAAIKFMRMHGQRTSPDKVVIVSLQYGFHGKTMGSQQASGRPEAKEWIGHLDPNFVNIPVPYAPLCPNGHPADEP